MTLGEIKVTKSNLYKLVSEYAALPPRKNTAFKKDYKKNRYEYEDRTVKIVEENWDMALKDWGYNLS